MKVVCIFNEIDDALAKKIGLPEREPRLYKSISPGKEYLVLGLTYSPSSSCYAGFPALEIKNDAGGLSVVPLFMFDISNALVSKHWHIKFESGILKILPESFYTDFYHDDLSEGSPEIVEDFKGVYQKIESEFLN